MANIQRKLCAEYCRHSTQAHAIEKQIDIVVAQPCLMKLAHRLVQIPRQLRYRLSAHRLSRDARHYPTHLLIREAFLRGISTRRARPLRPAAENVSAPPAESSSPGCARCAAESYRSGSRNRARSTRCGK